MNSKKEKPINAFAVEAMGTRFRWECPHCFLDQYGETNLEVGAIIHRVCEDPDCSARVLIKVEDELPENFGFK